MRLIDKDELKLHKFFFLKTDVKDVITRSDIYMAGWNDAIDAIVDNAPTIDAVEVVRCKDCKYSKHLKQYPKVNTWKCTLTDVVYRADDYCSYGERKEDNEAD